MVGVLHAELDRLQRGVVQESFGVGVAVILAVRVGDVMQRREVEHHLPRILRIEVEELHLRRLASQVIAERSRRAELDERLRIGIAVGFRVAGVEVHGP